jgi:aldehyde:ferredoxin oxidoreductase
MKFFKTHIQEKEAQEQLDEALLRNLVRTGSVLANANASKRHGDTAVKHLKNVKSILNKPIPQNSDAQMDARLERIEKSLEHMAMAMIATRSQIGAVGSISTSSALLADTVSKAITKR